MIQSLKLTLQENHEIKINFRYKKKLVAIVTKLETTLETKNTFGF